jgi:hypothetical protein
MGATAFMAKMKESILLPLFYLFMSYFLHTAVFYHIFLQITRDFVNFLTIRFAKLSPLSGASLGQCVAFGCFVYSSQKILCNFPLNTEHFEIFCTKKADRCCGRQFFKAPCSLRR